MSLGCSCCFGGDWVLLFSIVVKDQCFMVVALRWLAVILVTHVYFCTISPFLGVVSVFLVLVLIDLGSCSQSISALPLA